MQTTSNLYNSILASEPHWYECSLVIGTPGKLINNVGEYITFGGTAILIARGGADSGYQESMLYSMTTKSGVFSGETPTVGNAISSEINIEMVKPTGEIPRMAQLIPYVRICNNTQQSEWLQQGVYYIDTRQETNDIENLKVLTLHGYDAMLFADADYGNSSLSWNNTTDIQVLQEVASKIGAKINTEIVIEPSTITAMNKGYIVNYPAGYTLRETLGYLGSMYGGNFIFDYKGQLKLVRLADLPLETRYLITGIGEPITFGGDRILV